LDNKALCEVFPGVDFGDENISSCKVESINLLRKTNCLTINIESNKMIKSIDTSVITEQIKNKYNFENVVLNIKDIEKNNEFEWNNILNSLNYTHIANKVALANSQALICDNTIDIKLNSKSKFLLQKSNMDREISNYIVENFNKHFKINFIDPENDENIDKEETIVKEILKNKPEPQEKRQSMAQENPQPIPNNNYRSKKRNNENILNIEKLIYKGWRDVKSPVETKIIDLGEDTPSIILVGKISNYESRETKKGGYLISFDMYDGSSSINIKAFLKANEFEEVDTKMKAIK
jgi:DNA polymerase-3 subunit alpha (Gram-positive type)